jgi:hypothetical protein
MCVSSRNGISNWWELGESVARRLAKDRDHDSALQSPNIESRLSTKVAQGAQFELVRARRIY